MTKTYKDHVKFNQDSEFCIIVSKDEAHPELNKAALRELNVARKNAGSTEGQGFFPAQVKKALIVEELTKPLIRDKFPTPNKKERELKPVWEALQFVGLEVVDIYPFRDYPPED